MAGSRSSKFETEKRVFAIQMWIINGLPDYLILKNIEQQYGVCRRQSKNLLKKAYTIWCEEQHTTIEQKRSLKIAKLQQDIRNMSEEFRNTPKGMAVKLSYEKEINKLEGIYHAKQLTIKGDPDNPLILQEGFGADKQARLNALLTKAMLFKEPNKLIDK